MTTPSPGGTVPTTGPADSVWGSLLGAARAHLALPLTEPTCPTPRHQITQDQITQDRATQSHDPLAAVPDLLVPVDLPPAR